MRKFLPALLCAAIAAVPLASCGNKGGGGQTTAEMEKAKGDAFLERNAKAEGVVTTASGLQYKVLRSGPADGASPKMHDLVRVHYEGRFLGEGDKVMEGEVFDSSYERGIPTSFELGTVVKGWDEALQLMKPGDEWMLYLKPDLGYGPEGRGPIPPNSVLIFKVELLSFVHL